jgi:hypothetical protein
MRAAARLWNVDTPMKEARMHRRALGMAVRAGTLGALAAAVAAIGPLPPAAAGGSVSEIITGAYRTAGPRI